MAYQPVPVEHEDENLLVLDHSTHEQRGQQPQRRQSIGGPHMLPHEVAKDAQVWQEAPAEREVQPLRPAGRRKLQASGTNCSDPTAYRERLALKTKQSFSSTFSAQRLVRTSVTRKSALL